MTHHVFTLSIRKLKNSVFAQIGAIAKEEGTQRKPTQWWKDPEALLQTFLTLSSQGKQYRNWEGVNGKHRYSSRKLSIGIPSADRELYLTIVKSQDLEFDISKLSETFNRTFHPPMRRNQKKSQQLSIDFQVELCQCQRSPNEHQEHLSPEQLSSHPWMYLNF